METIYEDSEEQDLELKVNWLSSLRRRFRQSTISVKDCSLFVYCILGTVILSYSILSDSILDIFYYVSHESEAIATAYTQILEDLQYAFAIIGGLLADCLYGRIPVMVWSYLAYTACVSITFLVVSFASPVFYLVFALVTLSSMTYGIVISCTLTLVLNYDSLMTIKRSSTLIRCVCKILLIWCLSTLVTRTVMTWIPFLAGFRILSLLSVVLLAFTAHLAHSKRHHFINIPIQGNPVKEYTHSARILSREYNYPIADASAVTTTGVQVLHQASTDYYTRSVSQDSVDGSPPVLRASSVDQYYTTQDVIVPSTTNISPLFSNSADMSLVLNSNCDEPPSHHGVRIKVLRPVYKDPTLLEGYKEEKRCRETAMLLRNGMETNLLGQLFRVTNMVWIASIQIIYWCSLEFTKGVLLAQVDFLPHSSLMSVLLIEMTYPAIQVVATIIAYMVILYMRSATRMTASSLQIIGLGYITLIIAMVVTASTNSFILLMEAKFQSITLLALPCIITALSEILVIYGSILHFYEESPRRSQAVLLSLSFLSRYCGSLLFYAVLPVLNALCRLDTSASRIYHYEFGLMLQCVFLFITLGLHVWRAMKYHYVTEKELDKECENLRPDRILHPYLTKVVDPIKNRSKSCDSGSSSAKTSMSARSLSDEVLLVTSTNRVDTSVSRVCYFKHIHLLFHFFSAISWKGLCL